MKRFFTAFQATLAAAIAIKVNKYFVTVANLGEVTSLSIATGASILSAQLMDFIFSELPRRVLFFRKIADPRAKYEGTWILALDHLDARPYSIATIEYNPDESKYVYFGTAYTPGGKTAARWSSSDLTFNYSENEMRFLSDGQFRDKTAENLRTWGVIHFNREKFGNEYTYGEGFFIDTGTEVIKIHFNLDRITKDLIKSLINRETFRSNDDRSQFIRAYHESRQSNGST